MDLKTAREHFSVRLYRWAIDDFRREALDGLPFILHIKGSTACRFVEIWNSLSGQEQKTLQAAFIKHAHREAVEITGEYLTCDEEESIDEYRRLARFSNALESQHWARRLSGQGHRKKINRRRFAKRVRQEIEEVLGQPVQAESTRLVYDTLIDPWTIRTDVSVGQPSWYFHRIVAVRPVWLFEGHLEILTWLGIGQSIRDLIFDDIDATEAALSIAATCSHFMKAVPRLLDGLSHDLPPAEPDPSPLQPLVRPVKKAPPDSVDAT